MKKTCILLLTFIMLFAISACGDKAEPVGQGNLSPDTETESQSTSSETNTYLEKAINAIENVETFKVRAENSADINIGGMTTAISVKANGECDVLGGVAHVNMEAKSGPLTMKTEGYAEINGKTASVYVSYNNMWIRQTVPVTQLDTYGMGLGGVEGLRFYLESFETDEMEIVGGECVIKGHILPEKTLDVISAMNAGSQMPETGITSELIETMLDDMERIKITFRVNTSNFFVNKIEIDAAEAMNYMYEHMMDGLGTTSRIRMSVENNRAYMEYYDYNVPLNITIPDDVRNK